MAGSPSTAASEASWQRQPRADRGSRKAGMEHSGSRATSDSTGSAASQPTGKAGVFKRAAISRSLTSPAARRCALVHQSGCAAVPELLTSPHRSEDHHRASAATRWRLRSLRDHDRPREHALVHQHERARDRADHDRRAATTHKLATSHSASLVAEGALWFTNDPTTRSAQRRQRGRAQLPTTRRWRSSRRRSAAASTALSGSPTGTELDRSGRAPPAEPSAPIAALTSTGRVRYRPALTAPSGAIYGGLDRGGITTSQAQSESKETASPRQCVGNHVWARRSRLVRELHRR